MIEKDGFSGKESEIKNLGILIEVMGPVGVGKSTLTKILGPRWGIKPIFENYENNPYLGKFYDDPAGNSFKSQTWFLLDRIERLSTLDGKKTELIDAGLIMYFCYARTQNLMGWMNNDEWKIYQQMYSTLIEEKRIPPPDLVIIVTSPADKLLERIENRGRSFEKGIWKNYLETLSQVVNNFEKEIGIKILSYTIDTGLNDLLIPTSLQNSMDKVETFIKANVKVECPE